MGERKVLNKYIPPDFDPALIPRGKKLSAKDGTVPVRMMLPFTAQCATCHTFLYRGTKFNSKKEAMGGPDGTYLGITRWRFYIKCTSCARPLTFLTDPKNADYEMESGGTRNYEVYKDKAETEEAAVQEKEEEEKLDPMKALENRVLDSQREMQEMASLEAIRAMNTRHVHLLLSKDRNDLLGDEGGDTNESSSAKPDHAGLLTEEDEALIKSIQFGSARGAAAAPPPPSSMRVHSSELKRLDEHDEERSEQERKRTLQQLELQQQQLLERTALRSKKSSAAMPVIVKKRKRVIPPTADGATATGSASTVTTPAAGAAQGGPGTEPNETTIGMGTARSDLPPPTNRNVESTASVSKNGLSSLLGGYGSDDDSD